jgi:hypothetical protein
VFDEFGKEVIEERFNIFLSMVNSFISSIPTGKFVVNDYILMHSLLCYYSDVQRLKDFHRMEKANLYKIVAYESYWFLQRKPIQVIANDEDLLYINEKFVVSYIMDFLNSSCELNLEAIKSDVRKQEQLDAFMNSLFYFLKYRLVTAQMLEMFLFSFKTGNLCAV